MGDSTGAERQRRLRARRAEALQATGLREVRVRVPEADQDLIQELAGCLRGRPGQWPPPPRHDMPDTAALAREVSTAVSQAVAGLLERQGQEGRASLTGLAGALRVAVREEVGGALRDLPPPPAPAMATPTEVRTVEHYRVEEVYLLPLLSWGMTAAVGVACLLLGSLGPLLVPRMRWWIGGIWAALGF